ncbi:MAG TPA: metal-dependent transcriptional regulator [Chthonomonadaceae bacterium]|nr:metal-dependent transcriptional regulator [Chthonomonadaceae bacterium]
MSDTGERIFSQAVEDYVKAIYKLQNEGQSVSTTDLAKKIGATPAAATKMIKHLAENRLIDHTPYYGVRLTLAGERVALEIIRHHRLLELYLHQALGYGWDEVDAEAEKLEHHISEEFEERIDRMLDYPRTDPHGDPIPTRDGLIEPNRGKPLAESEPGETLMILRVRDSSPEALRYLASIGLHLEVVVRVKEKQPLDGALTLDVNGVTRSVGRELAGYVFVEDRKAREEVSVP